MLFTACFLLLLSFPLAAAADRWDDFSNDFATDLAPLLSLFAPIGILTAVVSVIRTCGSPSLCAFIGRV
ncbi:hypothetical protein V2G26_015618 [Clonostachys chloroleuca]